MKKALKKTPAFVQITSAISLSVERLYALDKNGRVWEWWPGIPGESEGWELLSDQVLPETK